jgi:putative ABC transport system permease protein
MLTDLRQALRTLAASPGFTTVAVLVLALGIGVNVAIFSIVNAVLFRPVAAHRPDELSFVYSRTVFNGRVQFSGLSYDNYAYVRDHNSVFSGMAARAGDMAVLRTSSDRESLVGEAATGNYFSVLGVAPVLGRALTPEDDRAGAAPVVVISHALWVRRFDRAADVLGRTLQLTPGAGMPTTAPGRQYEIVGVMPPAFTGTMGAWSAADYWVPVHQRRVDYDCMRHDPLRALIVIGRLSPGATAADAQALIPALSRHVPDQPTGAETVDFSFAVRDGLNQALPFDYRIVPERLASGLIAVSGILLLIAGANLAGMMSARAVVRRRELAVRLTLGASRWRIARQLLTESLLLTSLGAAGGLLVARALVGGFVVFLPSRVSMMSRVPMGLDVPVDGRVLIFTVLVAIVTGVGIGLAPLRVANRRDILSAIAGGTMGSTRAVRSRLRHAVVLPQICCSLVLLLVAGTLVRTTMRTERTPAGFDASGVVVATYMSLSPPQCTPAKPEEYRAWSDRARALDSTLLERARRVPGVGSAAVAVTLPTERFGMTVIANGAHATRGYHPVGAASVTSDYLRTLKIPLLQGRNFDARDTKDGARVAIVSASLAELLWPGRNPIGERLASSDPNSKYPPQWMEVVGVVGEVRHPLSEGGNEPRVYIPFDQSGMAGRFLVARAIDGRVSELALALRAILIDVNPNALILNSRTLAEEVGTVRYPRRLAAAALGIAGIIGLLLAGIGVYGVMAYSVAQRVPEIGVRTALGAARGDVVRMILREGLKVGALGALGGAALTYAALRVVSSAIIALPAFDVATLIVAPAVLLAAILIACYVPARRAARVDPLVALRQL